MDELTILNEEHEPLPQTKIDVGKKKRTFSQFVVDLAINFIKGLPKSMIIGAVTGVAAGLMAKYLPLFHGIPSLVFSLMVSLVVLVTSIMTMIMRKKNRKKSGNIKTMCLLLMAGLVMFNLHVSVFAEKTDFSDWLSIGQENSFEYGPHNVVVSPNWNGPRMDYIIPDQLETNANGLVMTNRYLYYYIRDNGMFMSFENDLTSAVIPYIASGQFPDKYDDTSLSAQLKDEIKSDYFHAGPNAYQGQNNLTSVTLEQGFTNCDFSGSKNLESASLPDGIKTVNFESCVNLNTVNLPGTIEKIGGQSFVFCRSLRNVTLSKNLKEVGTTAFTYSGIEKPFHVTLENGCVPFGYSGCDNIKVISLPACCTSMGSYAGMENLQLISLPASIDRPEMMYKNPKLKAVVIYNDKMRFPDWEDGMPQQMFGESFDDPIEFKVKTIFDGCPNLTIYCNAGSTAAAYAEKWKIPWKPINQLPKELKELENENTPEEPGNTDDPSNPGKTPPKPGDPDYRYDPDDPDNPYPPENKNRPIPTGVETTLLTAAELAALEAIKKNLLKAGYMQTEDGHFWRTETGKDQTVIYEYNEKGELLGRSKNKADGTSERAKYTLDSNGNITQTITTHHSPDGTTSNKVDMVGYDQNGKITTTRTVNTDRPTYDSNGNPDYQTVEQRWFDSDGHSYKSESYYENGQLKQQITENTNYEQQSGDVLGGQIGNHADYDINNQLITTTVNYSPDGTVTSTVDTTYIKVDIGNGKTKLIPQGQVMK